MLVIYMWLINQGLLCILCTGKSALFLLKCSISHAEMWLKANQVTQCDLHVVHEHLNSPRSICARLCHVLNAIEKGKEGICLEKKI